jgi:hypothetical protein
VLHAAFVPFGDIKDVNIPLEQTTQKNRGFAFVTFVETCVRGRPTTRTRPSLSRARLPDEPGFCGTTRDSIGVVSHRLSFVPFFTPLFTTDENFQQRRRG